jgi:hypothetical protein
MNPSWETASCTATSEFSNILRNPKDYSYKLSTGLYPEPDQSSPYHPIPSLLSPF